MNDREEWHDKEIVRDSKVGRWVDDWRAGLPDEYEVGGSVGPGPTVVEAEQFGEVVAGAVGVQEEVVGEGGVSSPFKENNLVDVRVV